MHSAARALPNTVSAAPKAGASCGEGRAAAPETGAMALLATAGGRVNKQPKLAAVDESDAAPEQQPQSINEPDESAIRDTVEHFCRLLEKSKQLFNGLREVPQYGQKAWQAYFARTFEVYTKLWKFQQDNRAILEKYYQLKRWQIGEIASKIGQLYYHYYLRTSEASYLHEAFSFYSAIRSRSYYAKAKKEETPEVMVKKLRYYARFIVVSLLLRRMELVSTLVKELAKHVEDYRGSYGTTVAEDEYEWKLVVSELRAFIGCDELVAVGADEAPPSGGGEHASHRLSSSSTPEADRSMPHYLSLEDVLVVGNSSQQVKFSELSLDMFRMLQVLEREPQEELLVAGSNRSLAGGGSISAASGHHHSGSPSGFQRQSSSEQGRKQPQNPHKYLLYKPTIAQFMTYAATAFRELGPGAALLVYLSADPSLPGSKKEEAEVQYENGGVAMCAAAAGSKDGEGPVKSRRAGAHEMHCLYPGDLLPFTRKPLFLIVESPNAVAFKSMSRLFSQPLVVLIAPAELPGAVSDVQHQGGLMTTFLFDPVAAFLYVCSLSHVSADIWTRCSGIVRQFLDEANKLLVKSRSLHHDFMQFYGDDFLRTFLLRFVFCHVCLEMHRAFKGPTYLPTSLPEMPQQEILTHESLQNLIKELASCVDMTALFLDSIKAA